MRRRLSSARRVVLVSFKSLLPLASRLRRALPWPTGPALGVASLALVKLKWMPPVNSQSAR